MPRMRPASVRRRVSWRSSWLGSGSPDGRAPDDDLERHGGLARLSHDVVERRLIPLDPGRGNPLVETAPAESHRMVEPAVLVKGVEGLRARFEPAPEMSLAGRSDLCCRVRRSAGPNVTCWPSIIRKTGSPGFASKAKLAVLFRMFRFRGYLRYGEGRESRSQSDSRNKLASVLAVPAVSSVGKRKPLILSKSYAGLSSRVTLGSQGDVDQRCRASASAFPSGN